MTYINIMQERAKKRIAIMSERVRQEAAERRLMSSEDLPRHRRLPGADRDQAAGPVAAKEKVTREIPLSLSRLLFYFDFLTRDHSLYVREPIF